MARATTSLPVPLSPVSSTVASLCSRFSMSRKMRSSAGERPMRPGKGEPAWTPVLLGRAQDDDVGHARVAHRPGLRAERRGGHRHGARRGCPAP